MYGETQRRWVYVVRIRIYVKSKQLPLVFSASSDTSITTLCPSLGVRLVLLLNLGTSSSAGSLFNGEGAPLSYAVMSSATFIE